MKSKKNRSSFPKIIIITLLICLTLQDANYLLNSNFAFSGCTPTSGASGSPCDIATNAVTNWDAIQYNNGGNIALVGADRLRIRNALGINIDTSTLQNAIWMFDSTGAKPLCISQTIAALLPGDYTLDVSMFLPNTATNPGQAGGTFSIRGGADTIYSSVLAWTASSYTLHPGIGSTIKVSKFYENAIM
jgi:hypothetical protein